MRAAISRTDLFQRLAGGHAGGVTVVTPNRRLAQALQGEFDAFQAARGVDVWEAPDLLPFTAFVERLYEDALYADPGDGLTARLTPTQEEVVWQDVIRQSREGSGFLFVEQAAAHCRDAWRLRHLWRIDPVGGNEDAAAFRSWSAKYAAATRKDVDGARLPDLAAALLHEPSLKKPKVLVAYAFDVLPPQTREFLDACAGQGIEVLECQPERISAAARRVAFPSAREELEAAAAWARARLASGSRRIGVVIPGLQQRRKEVARVFSQVMAPGFNLPGATRQPLAFNISIGEPLSSHPLIQAALLLLELSFGELRFDDVSRLLRSPFLAAAEGEWPRRAQLDIRLRRTLGASVPLPKLLGAIAPCPALRHALEKMFRLAQEAKGKEQAPSAWARHFSALLQAAGFPGERTLDSDEFQTQAKWHEMLGELAKLDRVLRKAGIAAAFHTLERLCAETLFQPESGDAPVQVLGILESAGLCFDHLWVSGLTDEAWPIDARPNPFIPVRLQKEAGIPEASAEGSLALDKRITEGWLGAAGEVVLSWPRKEEDRDLAPSPLIAGVPEQALGDIPAVACYRDQLFSQRQTETVEDAVGPRVKATQIKGGTRVLADQAACPFRAFAKWRLGAQPLETPAAGLDAMARGNLLHELMKNLWRELKDSDHLQGALAPSISRAAQAAVDALGLEGRFAELERERLARLAGEWLEIEKARAPFEVVAVEEKRTLSVAGLEFTSRIDRMDRLLEPVEGGHVLIDYKTGRPSTRHWEPPRPEDPQLPLYAVAAKEAVAAVAFASLRPGEMKFIGYSRDEDVIAGVKRPKSGSWSAVMTAWKAEAEALGAAFAAGEAGVDPKHELTTCRLCALHTLCRVHEKFSALALEAGGESGE